MLTPYWEQVATNAQLSELEAPLARYRAAKHPTDRGFDRDAWAAASLEVYRRLATRAPEKVNDALKGAPEETPLDVFVLGELTSALGRLPEAMAHCADALARYTALGDRWMQLLTVNAYAVVCARLGDISRAARAMQDGISLAQELGERRMEAMFMANLGYLFGEHDEAGPYEEYTRQALRVFVEIGERRLHAHSLCNLGGALARMGRLAEAATCYDEGWAIAQTLDVPRLRALFLAGLGGLRFAQGRGEEGLTLYRESLVLLKDVGDTPQYARHVLLMGRHLVEASRHREAIPLLNEALQIADRHHYAAVRWQAHEHLATAHEALGDTVAALHALREHMALRAAFAEARIDERVRAAELRFAAETARREVDLERRRVTELERVNNELSEALARQVALQTQLEELARTDGLTALSNRRHAREVLTQEIQRARRRWRPFAVALIDADHFKAVNDTFGHAVGDEVLVEFGRRLRSAVRTVDVVARWGGEEFLVGLLDTSGLPTREVAARLQRALHAAPFRTSAGDIVVTGSIGVTDLRDEDETLDALLRRADAALYRAKAAGRACVVNDVVEAMASPAPAVLLTTPRATHQPAG